MLLPAVLLVLMNDDRCRDLDDVIYGSGVANQVGAGAGFPGNRMLSDSILLVYAASLAIASV
jgi:hypothetical protein